MADNIDVVHRDQSGVGALLAIGADPTDMAGVAERHAGDASLPGASDNEIHGLAGDRLAQPKAAIDRYRRETVGDYLSAAIGEHPALGDPGQVGWRHADAVGVVALQVGRHQVLGANAGAIKLRPRSFEHGGDERGEAVGGNTHQRLRPRWWSEVGAG